MKVDKEFQSLIPPLLPDELALLEQSIIADGCRDPLTVWIEKDILVDGHNRYNICEKHGLDYDIFEKSFSSREEVEDWIDANQLGRRNLSPDQMRILRGRRYNRLNTMGHGSKSARQNVGQNPQMAAVLAQEHGVTSRTIERDGKLARELGQEQIKAVMKGESKIADIVRENKRGQVKSALEDISVKEAKKIEGVYDVIVIDPPWPMQKIERNERPNQVALDYPTMTEEELKLLEIPCADNCHVWLWTTQKYLPMAFRLLESWGLKYVLTMVWHKAGGPQPFGLPQYNCEFALYARRGSPMFLDTKDFPACFTADRGKHSEKPERFYSTVRRVTAGRRLDMFNRREIEGFEGWGKESC